MSLAPGEGPHGLEPPGQARAPVEERAEALGLPDGRVAAGLGIEQEIAIDVRPVDARLGIDAERVRGRTVLEAEPGLHRSTRGEGRVLTLGERGGVARARALSDAAHPVEPGRVGIVVALDQGDHQRGARQNRDAERVARLVRQTLAHPIGGGECVVLGGQREGRQSRASSERDPRAAKARGQVGAGRRQRELVVGDDAIGHLVGAADTPDARVQAVVASQQAHVERELALSEGALEGDVGAQAEVRAVGALVETVTALVEEEAGEVLAEAVASKLHPSLLSNARAGPAPDHVERDEMT